MGCLKNIIKAVILVLAFIGFNSLGGMDYFTNLFNNFNNPEVMLERSKKIGDFSNIGEEFEIAKSVSALGYNGVLAEHKSSGQKMLLIDSGKKPLLTQKDFNDNEVEKKLQALSKKFKYQYVNVENLTVTKKGTIKMYGKSSPYVRFNAKIKNLPVGEVSGIISAVENTDGETRLALSISERDKYSQLIAEEFFKKVR